MRQNDPAGDVDDHQGNLKQRLHQSLLQAVVD